jgi:predicted nucleic acid-binding protein
MEKVLFDTSTWINFAKGKISKDTNLLAEYLVIKDNLIFISPTIIQEFLMGAKSDFEFTHYKIQFDKLFILDDSWLETSIAAAKLYLELRKKGVTIRKAADCLIAQVAIQNNILLVHNDSDFELIAQNSPLRTFC